jgi:hypothetical protein
MVSYKHVCWLHNHQHYNWDPDASDAAHKCCMLTGGVHPSNTTSCATCRPAHDPPTAHTQGYMHLSGSAKGASATALHRVHQQEEPRGMGILRLQPHCNRYVKLRHRHSRQRSVGITCLTYPGTWDTPDPSCPHGPRTSHSQTHRLLCHMHLPGSANCNLGCLAAHTSPTYLRSSPGGPCCPGYNLLKTTKLRSRSNMRCGLGIRAWNTPIMSAPQPQGCGLPSHRCGHNSCRPQLRCIVPYTQW